MINPEQSNKQPPTINMIAGVISLREVMVDSNVSKITFA